MTEWLISIRVDSDRVEERQAHVLEACAETAITDWLDSKGFDYRITGSGYTDIGEALPPDAPAVGPFRKDGGKTQRDAAYANYPKRGTQRYRVLMLIARRTEFNGITRDQIALELGLADSSVDARVWELLKGKWVVETNRTQKTSHGSAASTLKVSPDRIDELLQKEGIHE